MLSCFIAVFVPFVIYNDVISFFNGASKASYFGTLLIIVTMGIIYQACGSKVKCTGGRVDKRLVGSYVYNACNEHVVATQWNYLFHFTFDAKW